MVDLYNQYKKIKPEIDGAIQNVINVGAFINGPDVKIFEQNLANYLQVKHVIGCANGTDALLVALMALNLKKGDEVIVPSFTFVSPVEVVGLLGLTPVFVDVDKSTFNLDVEQVENSITEKTKVIIPVHLYGQSCNLEKLKKLALKYDLFLVEDNAQAIGADYIFTNGDKKKVGTIGNIGCTSFFPSKNLGCFGDGGAIFTDDDKKAEEIRCIINHGAKKKYFNERLGINSRLDTIQAAILNVKLKYLDSFIVQRQKVAEFYDKSLSFIDDIVIPQRTSYSTHVFHQYTIRAEKERREALKLFLQKKDIPSMVYYPKPLNEQEAFYSFYKSKVKLDVSKKTCDEVLSLPMHTELSEEQLIYITDTIKEFFN